MHRRYREQARLLHMTAIFCRRIIRESIVTADEDVDRTELFANKFPQG